MFPLVFSSRDAQSKMGKACTNLFHAILFHAILLLRFSSIMREDVQSKVVKYVMWESMDLVIYLD